MGWKIVGINDFNGVGYAKILWRESTSWQIGI
jgi:hypothetical protein